MREAILYMFPASASKNIMLPHSLISPSVSSLLFLHISTTHMPRSNLSYENYSDIICTPRLIAVLIPLFFTDLLDLETNRNLKTPFNSCTQ